MNNVYIEPVRWKGTKGELEIKQNNDNGFYVHAKTANGTSFKVAYFSVGSYVTLQQAEANAIAMQQCKSNIISIQDSYQAVSGILMEIGAMKNGAAVDIETITDHLKQLQEQLRTVIDRPQEVHAA